MSTDLSFPPLSQPLAGISGIDEFWKWVLVALFALWITMMILWFFLPIAVFGFQGRMQRLAEQAAKRDHQIIAELRAIRRQIAVEEGPAVTSQGTVDYRGETILHGDDGRWHVRARDFGDLTGARRYVNQCLDI